MRTLHLLLVVVVLGCGQVAQSSTLVRVSPALFRPDETPEEGHDCSAAQMQSKTSVPLMHVQAKCSPFRKSNSTWLATLMDSINGDDKRYAAITRGARRSFTSGAEEEVEEEEAGLQLSPNRGSYIINLGFGTPSQSFYTVIDTGSDITWIPCAACNDCEGNVFDASKSSTYKYLTCSSDACRSFGVTPNCGNNNCSFPETYGDGSQVVQLISTDTLAVAPQTSVPGFIFGCAGSREGLITSAPGLVGLGRSSISFVSQTAKEFEKTFSYCIPTQTSTGCLQLGKSALSTSGLQFTSLLTNSANPSFYYVALTGISVGAERVAVAAMEESSGRGTIIDSGTTITRLVEPAYSSVRDSFLRQVGNLSRAPNYSIFDACFNFPSGSVKVPRITLHFDKNVDVPLPPTNYLIGVSAQGSVGCLAFAPPPSTSDGSEVSILGSFQQRNFRVVYDVAGSRLGITPQTCAAC